MTVAYVAFATVCIVWGTTYLAISVALETVPVLLLAGLRWMTAGVVMSALMLATGRGLPSPGAWGPLLFLGFMMNVVGNGLVVYAQQYVPSGLTAVLIATTPFWTALLERALPGGERFPVRALAGLSLGFSGIVTLVWPQLTDGGASGRAFVGGVIAIQLACIGWVIGTSYAKRHPFGGDPFRSTALQMVFSGTMLLTAATAHGDWQQVSFTWTTGAALLYLAIAGSLVAYSAYVYAIQHLPLSFVSLYAYINPIIAVTLGTLLLGEPLTTRVLVASGLVLAGTAVVGRRT